MCSADDPEGRLLAAKTEARRARRLAKSLSRKEDQDRLLAYAEEQEWLAADLERRMSHASSKRSTGDDTGGRK